MDKFSLLRSGKLVSAFVKETNKTRKKTRNTSTSDPSRISLKKSNGYSASSIPTMDPISFYEDIPQFSKEQYEWYWDKLPERYEILETEPEYLSYVPYSELNSGIDWIKTRPIHRYFLMDRFKFTLYQLVGLAGDVPPHIIALFDKWEVRKVSGNHLWNYIRDILKNNNGRLYYNRIPSIILMLGLNQPAFMRKESIFKSIIADFNEMIISWETIKLKINRKYFINLRYVCLRLLAKHGIVFPYTIPLARMERSVSLLGSIYDDLWDDIMQRKLVEEISKLFDE
jgi:hypothetical protein